MSLISKTFGGLNKAYYFCHFFFGLILYPIESNAL